MLDRAQRLVEAAVVCPLPAPALNKWTKLGPTIAKVVFMSHFCGLLGYCLRQEFGKLDERDEEQDAGGADAEAAAAAAAVGLPLDERAEWRRVANQRRLKTVEFLEDREAAFGNLLWLVIAAPILTLHWKLFKHAKWVSERAADTEEGHIISRFCNPASNPAAAIIVTLLNILVNVQVLEVVCFFHGPLQQWSTARQLAVQQLVLVAAGQLWRKLVAPWLCYPWRMWPLAFSSNEEERRQAARELLAQRDCCLDECFSRKLRALAPDEDALLDMREFLQTCFTRVVATSTFVERRFAAYGAWSSRRAGTPRLPTLAAKHLTSCLRDFVEHWRERHRVGKKDSAKSRPSWVADRGTKRQTGLHVFSSERGHVAGHTLSGGDAQTLSDFLQETRRQWREELSAEDRARYSRRAKERNLLAAAQQQAQGDAVEVNGGPWCMASLSDRWPLRTELLAEAVQGTKRREMVQSWKSKYSEPEEELPNVSLPGEKDVHLFGACPQGGCESCLSAPQRLALRRLQLNLATLVRHSYPQPGQVGCGPLLLRLCSAGSGRRRTTKFVAVCFATRTNPPESVLLELTASGQPASGAPAALFLPNPVTAGHFCSDTVFSVRLVQMAPDWTFGVLRLGDPGGNLDRFVISGEDPFSHEDLEQQRQETTLQEAALRAAKAANTKRQERGRSRKKTEGPGPKSRRAKSAGQTCKVSKRKRSQTGRHVVTDDEGSVSAVETDDGDAISSHSSATWTDPESEADALPTPAASTPAPASSVARAPAVEVVAPAEDGAVPGLRHGGAAGDDVAPAAARGAGGSLPGRQLQQRAEPWGPFSISKIVRSRDGQVTGWGAICGFHCDHGMEGEAASKTQCKKAFSCGTRSREECVRLLKRWLLLGLMQQDEWPAHRRRTSHVHLPLHRLQEGPSEREMDEWMQNFMQRAQVAGGAD